MENLNNIKLGDTVSNSVSKINSNFSGINRETEFLLKIKDTKKEITNIKNISGKWVQKTWSGLSSFYGSYTWSDGDNVYYSFGSTIQYVLDLMTSTWSTKTWEGFSNLFGGCIWYDGDNIYHSRQGVTHQFNKQTKTWSEKTWNGFSNIDGQYIWTDKKNIYYSNGSNQYVLNRATSTWEQKEWNGFTNISGLFIWTDGINIYLNRSTDSYVLDTETSTWIQKQWEVPESKTISGIDIWSDGIRVYHSYYNSSRQYVLNIENSSWELVNWNYSSLNGEHIWKVGSKIFYSKDGNNYEYIDDSELSLKPLLGFKTNNLYFKAVENQVKANTTKLATIEEGAEVNAVDSVNGKTGTVVLGASDVGAYTIQETQEYVAQNGGKIDKIQKNGTDLEIVNKVVNITVPVTASDVNALPSSTKYGASIDLSINSTTYVVTAQLKDQDGNNLGQAKTIDLPLESIVTSATYYSVYTYDGTIYTKVIVITLATTSVPTIVPVGDLVAGLQAEITSSNKLSADLVDDTSTTNKFVTASDKTTWNGKQDAISDIETIRSNASAGAAAKTTIDTYGNIVTHDADEFATASQGAKADTAVQPGDLATVATSGNYSDLNGLPTLPTGTYIGTSTNWGVSPGVCYLRTNYFSGGLIPQKDGDLVYSIGSRNLHRCGTVTWDDDQNCYKTTPVFVANFTIPTVNDSTVTITNNNETVGSFTTNQSSNSTMSFNFSNRGIARLK